MPTSGVLKSLQEVLIELKFGFLVKLLVFLKQSFLRPDLDLKILSYLSTSSCCACNSFLAQLDF